MLVSQSARSEKDSNRRRSWYPRETDASFSEREDARVTSNPRGNDAGGSGQGPKGLVASRLSYWLVILFRTNLWRRKPRYLGIRSPGWRNSLKVF